MEINRDTKLSKKKLLRKEILQKRDALSAEEHTNFSEIIRARIREWNVYQDCECLLAFVSFGSEVDTHNLIQEALQAGKKVYCPRVMGDDMFFYKISSFEDLVSGYRGILEPKEGLDCLDCVSDKTLLLMPGSVFDVHKNRMGYGKGFYDRFLAECEKENRKITTAALAFSLQLVETVPVEEHDYQPEFLFTEKEIFGV